MGLGRELEGLVVVGVRCNDFGGQGPGGADEIKACAVGYQASFPLTETVAINQWVDQTFPAAKLLPTDAWQRLQAVSLLSWCWF